MKKQPIPKQPKPAAAKVEPIIDAKVETKPGKPSNVVVCTKAQLARMLAHAFAEGVSSVQPPPLERGLAYATNSLAGYLQGLEGDSANG